MEEERAHALRTVVDVVLAPLVQRDGGTLEFVSVDGPTVKVRMGGACSGCPGRTLTVEHVLLPALKRTDDTLERVDVELAI